MHFLMGNYEFTLIFVYFFIVLLQTVEGIADVSGAADAGRDICGYILTRSLRQKMIQM